MSLEWSIKRSLLGYVRGLPDGVVGAGEGAVEREGLFVFPAAGSPAGEHRFSGVVAVSGHDGLLDVVFREPWLQPGASGWLLSIADPDDGQRLGLLRIAALEAQPDGSLRATGTSLTQDGADLFFGPYQAGTAFDDPVVRFEH